MLSTAEQIVNTLLGSMHPNHFNWIRGILFYQIQWSALNGPFISPLVYNNTHFDIGIGRIQANIMINPYTIHTTFWRGSLSNKSYCWHLNEIYALAAVSQIDCSPCIDFHHHKQITASKAYLCGLLPRSILIWVSIAVCMSIRNNVAEKLSPYVLCSSDVVNCNSRL